MTCQPRRHPWAPTATPAATAALADGFHYGDILKIQVNRLAARIAPKRTAALVHGYDLSGPAPIDGGSVRLNKGDYVSVQLGPVPIGDTTWYLVWPATATTLHPGGLEWYTSPPPDSSPVAAWVAASVGSDVYMSLQKRPSTAELESFQPIGLNVAGTGNYVSAPQARHDGFLIDWAAAAPTSGTSCAFKLALAPADADFTPEVAVYDVHDDRQDELAQWLRVHHGLAADPAGLLGDVHRHGDEHVHAGRSASSASSTTDPRDGEWGRAALFHARMGRGVILASMRVFGRCMEVGDARPGGLRVDVWEHEADRARDRGGDFARTWPSRRSRSRWHRW